MRIRAQTKWSILLSLLTLASSAVVSASTTVPAGEVSGSWSVAGSPYVVQGDVEIPGGETLVIEPGVTVQFETDAGMSANGTLTAIGTETSLIRFTSAQVSPGPGDWDGMEIRSSSSSLAWIQIDYAVDGLLIWQSSPTISDCTVRNNAETGIRVAARAYGCSGSLAAPTITRCQVELNLGDGVEYHGYGSGSVGCTTPKTGSVRGTLSESTVHHNTGTGIVMKAYDGYHSKGRAAPEVLDCDIHDNGGDGILLTGKNAGPTISGSDVYLNTQSGIVRESSLGTVTITNNELRENTGVGLRNSSYQTIVSGNRIINNDSEGVVTSQLRQFYQNTLHGNADDYDFIYLDTVDQVAPLNDWGTTDPVVIDSHIWDRLDNPSLGRVVVSPATDLVVTPAADLDFYGQQGGPFYPEKTTWTLWNTQADSLDWEIAGAESWLSVTPLSGTLAPFDSDFVTAETSAEAESLPPGTHTAILAFQNTATGDGDTKHTVRLNVLERHLAFVDVHSDGVYGGAESVAVSPDGAHLFVVSGNTLAVFVRDGVTGALTLLEEHEDGQGGVDGLFYAWSVALSPDGENVYVTGRVDNAIAVFDRNPVTGALVFLEVHKDGSFGVDGLDSAVSLAVSPDGAHVYVASWNDGIAVFARDTSTGRLTFVEVQKDGVGGVAGLDHAESLALSPDGSHVYVAAGWWPNDFLTVFVRDTSTGTLTFLETHEDGVDGVDGLNLDSRVALSPDGAHVYVTGDYDNSVALFARDTSTGALTFKRIYENNVDGGGLNGAVGLAVSGDGAYLYVASRYSDALSVFGRNAATGELLFVEWHGDGVDGVDGLDSAKAVAVSPDGTHVYVVSNTDAMIALFARVSALVADLSIAKSDSIDPVAAGGAFDYTLSVTNTGPSVAWSVRVEDALPAGVSMTDATGTDWKCGETGGLVTCSRDSLDVGTAPLLTLSVTAPLEGTVITNSALVGAESFDPDTGDNNASEQTALLIEPRRGIYWDRSKNGHGFDFQRLGDVWFMLFYSYRADGTPMWYLALGSLENGVFTGTATQFDYQANRTPRQREVPGTGGPVTIDFTSQAVDASSACNDGTDRSSAEALGVFTFDLDGQQDEWCVERSIFKNGQPDIDYTGSWHSSTDDGWGLTIYTQGKGEDQTLVVVIYYYDAEGQPRWALGVLNNPDFSGKVVVPMDQFSGYCLTCAVTALTTGDAGTVSLTLVQPSNSLEAGNITDVAVNFLGAPGGSWVRTDQPIQMLSDLPD